MQSFAAYTPSDGAKTTGAVATETDAAKEDCCDGDDACTASESTSDADSTLRNRWSGIVASAGAGLLSI